MSRRNNRFLLFCTALAAGTAACLGPLSRGGRPPTDRAEPPASSPSPSIHHEAPALSDTPLVQASTGAVPAASKFSLPLRSPRVLSPFGKRGSRYHAGIDLAHTRGGGDPVLAAADGVVVKVSHRGGYGRMVLLRHADGWLTRYAHLRRIDVKAGQDVRRGEALGLVGDTGRATAPHLHFEVLTRAHKAVDPAPSLFPKTRPASTAQGSSPKR